MNNERSSNDPTSDLEKSGADNGAANVALLAEFYLAELKAGRRPSRRSMLNSLSSRHADELGRMLDAIDTLEGEQLPKETKHRLWPTPPERIGEFEILREIGRGGMGVVYEALQPTLGRRVALKILTASRVDDRSAARFDREALAAARLHHTNIVPVYSVGSADADFGPIKFLAMQFINGVNLSAWRKPSDKSSDVVAGAEATTELNAGFPEKTTMSARCQGAAKIGAQIASALQYAHEQGVLHRDVKPGNIMVESNGHAWLVDFGVAKLADETAPLTRDDAVAGTLRYLAPERLQGREDGRSDVYSLAAALYECVAGRPAFTESDRIRLLHEVRESNPESLTAIDSSAPIDFSRVIEKGLRKDPSLRYRSAGEFGADLERFLAGAPVVARRLSTVQRTTRWMRRHPWITGLGVVAALSMAVGTTVSLHQARRAWIAEAQALKQAQLASERFDLAASAVDLFFNRVMDRSEWRRADFQPLFRDLLRDGADYYQKLATEKSNDLDRSAARAESLSRLAKMELKLGDHAGAKVRFQECLDEFDDICNRRPDHLEYCYLKALAQTHFANALNDAGDPISAKVRHLSARADFSALANAAPQRIEFAEGLAVSMTNLANLARDSGDLKSAAIEYEKAVEFLDVLADRFAKPDRLRPALAESLKNLGYTRQHLLELDAARAVYHRLIPIEEKIVAASEDDADCMRKLAATLHNYGEMLHYLREMPAAKEHLVRAMNLLESAARRRPTTTDIHAELAHTKLSLGELYSDLNDLESAERLHGEARRLCQQLVDSYPDVADYQLGLFKTMLPAARWLRQRQKWNEAHRTLDDAGGVLNRVSQSVPQHPSLARGRQYLEGARSQLWYAQAEDHVDSGRLEQGLACVLKSVAETPTPSGVHIEDRVRAAKLLGRIGRPPSSHTVVSQAIARTLQPICGDKSFTRKRWQELESCTELAWWWQSETGKDFHRRVFLAEPR